MTGHKKITIDAKDHPVTSVVVFKSMAEVTRTFSAELKTGLNEIEVVHLPSSLLRDGLRIGCNKEDVKVLEHTANAPQQLFAFGGAKPETKEMKDLRASKKQIEGQIQVLSAQAQILMQYSKTISSEHVDPEVFLKYTSEFLTKGSSNIDAVKVKEAELADIEKKIAEEAQKPWTTENQEMHRRTKVKVTLESARDQSAEISFVYVVTGTSWIPSYELKANSNDKGEVNKEVTLFYKAYINQFTGEDWANADITLNTSSGSSGYQLPAHQGVKVRKQNGLFVPKGGFTNYHQPQTQSVFAHPNQTSLFGQTSAPPPATNSFTFGGLSGSALPPQAATGAFGQPAQQFAVAQAPACTGFGGFGATNSNVQTGSGLFGSHATTSNTAQPSQGSGSFGNPVSTTSNSAGLFGSASTTTGASTFGTATALSNPHPSDQTGEQLADEGYYHVPALAEEEAPPRPASYAIAGKRTITSSSDRQKVTLATSVVLPLDVYEAVCIQSNVPVKAFTQGIAKNTTEEALLAGTVVVFLNDQYIGSKVLQKNILPGEAFEIPLGVNDLITVSFKHDNGKPTTVERQFTSSIERIKSKNIITIKNAGPLAVKRLIARDSIPVGEDGFKVVLETPAELAELEDNKRTVDVDGVKVRWSKVKPTSHEEGLVEWVLSNLGPGETKKVELAWTVEGPVGSKWRYSQF